MNPQYSAGASRAALDGARPADAVRLDAALGSALSEADVAELRRIIDDSGAHEQVEQVIGSLAATATDALAAADLDGHARAVLHDLATAATVRVV